MMKSRLTMTLIALVWATLLLAAYAVAAHAQTGITNNQQAKKSGAAQSSVSATDVAGSGTTGHLTKWASPTTLGDSAVVEDKSGRVAIGTTTTTSKLTIGGVIETTSGGIKFPDGTLQMTAATQTSSPPLQPFAKVLVANFPPGGGAAEARFTVPSGKRLVIETASLLGALSSSGEFVGFTINSTVGGEIISYALFPPKYSTVSLTSIFGITQPLKFYADPGTQVIVTLPQLNSMDTGGFSLTLSGYLVDAP